MRRGRRLVGLMVLACGLALAWAAPAWAQEDELRLSLRKEFGFAMGGQVQGTFKLTALGPADLISVTFELADEAGAVGPLVLGQASQPPFSVTFSTDKYPHGRYALSATGQTAGGRRIRSNVLRVEFVSAEAGWQAAGKIVIPLFVLLGAVMLAATLGPLVLERLGKVPPGRPRHYGLWGGAICPKCKRPFGLHWWAPNLVTGKYDRCPNCGRWSIVRPAGRAALAAAEAAEQAAPAPEAPELSPEEKLRRQIEDSRYV